MDIDEFESMCGHIIRDGNTLQTKRVKFGITSQIMSEGMFNLVRYFILNVGEPKVKTFKDVIKDFWNTVYKKKVKEVEILKRMVIRHLIKNIDSDCIFIPIKTTDRQCISLRNSNFEGSEIKHTEMAHWILAVFFKSKKELWIMDSLNSGEIVGIWKEILYTFLTNPTFISKIYKDKVDYNFKINIKTFNTKTIHQGFSVNCGHFCWLYMILVIRGLSLEEIEGSRMCHDYYIDKKLKKYLNKCVK